MRLLGVTEAKAVGTGHPSTAAAIAACDPAHRPPDHNAVEMHHVVVFPWLMALSHEPSTASWRRRTMLDESTADADHAEPARAAQLPRVGSFRATATNAKICQVHQEGHRSPREITPAFCESEKRCHGPLISHK